MASRKMSNSTGQDLLPPFVQQLMTGQALKYETDERFAKELYAASNNGMSPRDEYPDKDKYLALAKSLPSAYKAFWDTEPNNPGNLFSYAIRMVDVRAIFNDYAQTVADEETRQWAMSKVSSVGDYYESRARTLGFTNEQMSQYGASSNFLSPEGWAAATAAGVIQPAQPTGGVIPTTDTGGTDTTMSEDGTTATSPEPFSYNYDSLSSFDPAAYLRLDAQRTIQDLEYQLKQYSSANFSIDIEGLTAPMRVPSGAEPVSGGQAPAGTNWSVTQTIQYPYYLTEKQVQDLQTTLSRAGYYRLVGRGYSQFGKVDEETAMAWGFLLSDSIRNGKDPAQMLKQGEENYARMVAGNTMNIPYIDETRIWEAARTAAVETIGRGLTDAELKSFTQAFRQWEKDLAIQEYMGVDPTEQDVDLGARTNEYLRKRFEDESLATSVIATLDRYERLFNR